MKPSASSGSLSASTSTAAGSRSVEQEQAPASVAPAQTCAKPAAQPPGTMQIPLRCSSDGQPTPQSAPMPHHLLQPSSAEPVQSAGSSVSRSITPDAALRGPRLPDAPGGQRTSARPAPVRLRTAIPQHDRSSSAHSRPPPLAALLPMPAARSDHVQVYTYNLKVAEVFPGATAASMHCFCYSKSCSPCSCSAGFHDDGYTSFAGHHCPGGAAVTAGGHLS